MWNTSGVFLGDREKIDALKWQGMAVSRKGKGAVRKWGSGSFRAICGELKGGGFLR
jgi:hypothetical protein